MTQEVPLFIQTLNEVPLNKFLGVTVGEYGNGNGEMRVRVNENIINPAGAVHGGVYYILCDMTATLAFSTALDSSYFYVTHDINVSILKPTFEGEIIARASCIKVGKRLGFVECKLYNSDEEILAVGRVTKTILPKPESLK